jgi:AcrR family transcriptional regulator
MVAAATRARILTAAEDLVLSDGVARLTLEQAAARAGVSKGGVLYHFPSRSALIAGMVERLADSYDAGLEERLGEQAATPGGYARAYVEETFAPPPDAQAERGDRLGSAVLAAMASEPELLTPLRTAFDRWQHRIEADAGDPVAATIARLAADGLWLSELFGLGRIDPQLRRAVHDRLIEAVS